MISPIATIMKGLDVSLIGKALLANPWLWNQRRARTEDPRSPHYGLDDIWVRFAPPGVDGSAPHDAVWYRDVVDVLPVRDLVYDLAHRFRADRIGGVLMTRIPAGQSVKPHIDPGWHAGYYQKYAVQIRANPEQAFCFDGIEHRTDVGDVYWFDNSKRHWVTNASDEARITMIVCLRTETVEEVS